MALTEAEKNRLEELRDKRVELLGEEVEHLEMALWGLSEMVRELAKMQGVILKPIPMPNMIRKSVASTDAGRAKV